MPVRVSVPLRIRTDARALSEARADVAEALSAAAGRALRASREVVLEERGGYVGVRLHPPEIAWTGDGLGEVPSALRAEVEAWLDDELAALAEAAGVLDAAGLAAELPEPLARLATESPDPVRFHPELLRYVIPSYDGGGDAVAVPVDAPPPAARREAVLWLPFGRVRGRLMERTLEAVGRYGPLDTTGPFGVVYAYQDGLGFLIQVPASDGSHETFDFALPGIGRPGYSEAAGRWEDRSGIPPPAPATLRVHGPFASPEDAASVVQTRAESIVGQIHKPAALSQEEFDAALEEVLGRIRTAWLGGLSATRPHLLELRMGAYVGYFPVGEPVHWTGEADLLPLTEVVLRPERDEDEDARDDAGAIAGDDGAAAGEGGASGGRGAQGGTGGAGARRGIVRTARPGSGASGPLYPPSQYRSTEAADCSAFEAEPSLDGLGPDGQGLRDEVEALAATLEIRPCAHAGRFCLNAVRAIASRAAQVGAHAVTSEGQTAGFTEPVPSENGNLGAVQFVPTASPAIQFFRHLARLVPRVKLLAQSVHAVYGRHADAIGGTWSGDSTAWALQLFKAFSPALDRAVAAVFVQTCRVLLMQLLRSSQGHIQARLSVIVPYAQQFEAVVVPRLARIEDLTELRDELRDYEALKAARDLLGHPASGAVAPPVTLPILPGLSGSPWADAARDLVEMMMEAEARADVGPGQHEDRGRVVEVGGTPRIADGRGRYRTLAQIEEDIVANRGMIEAVDPLIKQFVELDEVMDHFRDPGVGVREELESVLNEMAEHNAEMQGKVAAGSMFAFRATAIRESVPTRTVPYSRYALGGIHLVAHEAIGEFFRGDNAYGQGINHLFGVEQGREQLGMVLEVAGLVALAVVCAPLAVAVGVGTAVYHVAEAEERERLYGALIDPELVASYADIEAELFGAYLGLAFSVLPGAGKAVGKGASAGVRTATRQGVRGAARTGLGHLGRAARLGPGGLARAGFAGARRHLTRAVAEQMKRDLLEELAKEIVTDRVVDLLLQQVLTPVIQSVHRESALSGPAGGMRGAQETIAGERARRAAAERRGPGGSTPPTSP